jgi:hypothetical protein
MSDLTEYDYAYLKGDKEVFPEWGAALSVVMTYCRNHGYGEFGKPTKLGKKVMEEYERQNLGSG